MVRDVGTQSTIDPQLISHLSDMVIHSKPSDKCIPPNKDLVSFEKWAYNFVMSHREFIIQIYDKNIYNDFCTVECGPPYQKATLRKPPKKSALNQKPALNQKVMTRYLVGKTKKSSVPTQNIVQTGGSDVDMIGKPGTSAQMLKKTLEVVSVKKEPKTTTVVKREPHVIDSIIISDDDDDVDDYDIGYDPYCPLDDRTTELIKEYV